MLRIAVDGVGAKEGGGAVVLRDFVAALLRRSDVGTVIAFTSPRKARSFDFDDDSRLKVVDVESAENGGVSRMAWLLRGLGQACAVERVDAVLGLSGAGMAGSIPVVTFIQQALLFEKEGRDLLSLPWRARMRAIRWVVAASSVRARSVIVQTEVMRSVVASHLGLPHEKIVAITPTPEPAEPSHGAPELEPVRGVPVESRLLYVGADKPYKNLEILPVAMARLRRMAPGATLFMTVRARPSGSRQEGIVNLGPLEPAVVREAYALCRAFVMPSLVETVGLPILEAFAAGVPVVVSDRPYAREVCGAAAIFFDPSDPDSLARAMDMAITDAPLRARLIAGGHARVRALAEGKPYDQMARLVVEAARK